MIGCEVANPQGKKKVKYENLLLFKEKKILMALNCLNISKSYTARGREREVTLPDPLHRLKPRRLLEI